MGKYSHDVPSAERIALLAIGWWEMHICEGAQEVDTWSTLRHMRIY